MLQLLLKLDLLLREVRESPMGKDRREPGSPDTVDEDPMKSLLLLPPIDSVFSPRSSSFSLEDKILLYDHNAESELLTLSNLVVDPFSIKSR